ncbi:MAG: 50S ribosomal protein L15 [Endomicrobium sp.]|jgi:large subunit ribosomal protein L15|nr:50S ribosomal protein L15 [Endomicrobium sp.]
MIVGLNNLHPAKGSKHRKKIVGRGVGSGHGRTSTRGSKGQKSRTGDGSKKVGFEGGQTPIFRRVPKRGFSNRRFCKKKYKIINVGSLNNFNVDSEITNSVLKKAGFIKKNDNVKILGTGNIDKALIIKVTAFSKSAIRKIKAAGGEAVVVGK